MATRKNNFLNAKPVSKMGGGSGGVRKPSKPYSKPPAKSNSPKLASKTKTQRLQEAAKTTPKSPAPKQVIKKPVTRTGPVKGPVPPKGSSSVSLPNSRRAGVNLPQAGARAERTATRVADLRKASAPKPTPAAPKPSAASRLGNAAKKASDWVSGNTPKQQAKPASRLAEALGGDRPAASRTGHGLVGKGSIAAMALGAANAADNARLTPAQRAKKNEVVNPDRGQNLLTKFQSGTLGQPNKPKPKQGNAQSRFAGARDANLNRINSDPRFAAPKPSPARPSASRPSQSTPSRSTASGSGSQRSNAPQPTKPAMPGQKWSDFNPGRGTSKSNNPLLDRDSGGMKLRDRMKQREVSAQGEKAKNLSSNFGQDSGYETKTKVDGSMYADKKPDMKKVNEYDRRKKRYYS